jgi:hypothetical protein
MTPPCPPRSQLERLVADQLDAAEDAALTRHVEGCAACQSLLEELSEGGPRTQHQTPGLRAHAFPPPPNRTRSTWQATLRGRLKA